MKKMTRAPIEVFQQTIRELLLGPGSDTFDDGASAEELISSSPLKRYYTGVLYPDRKDETHGARADREAAIHESDNEIPESDDEDDDNFSGLRETQNEQNSSRPSKVDSFTEENFHKDTISHFYPSDAGISFCLDESVRYIDVTFSFACYSNELKIQDVRLKTTQSIYQTLRNPEYEFPLKELLKFEQINDDYGYLSLNRELKGKKQGGRTEEYKNFDDWTKLKKNDEELKLSVDAFKKLIGPIWKRKFYKIDEQIDVSEQEISTPRKFLNFKDAGYTFKTFRQDSSLYVKLQLVNCFHFDGDVKFSTANEKINHSCLFQPEIAIHSDHLRHYSHNHSFQGDEEHRQLEFLFRKQKHFAVGHNCSVEWEKSDEPKWVKTSFLPMYELKGLTTKTGDHIDLFDLSVWGGSQAETINRIEQFVQKYTDWIGDQKNSRSASEKEAKQILERLDTTLTRLNEGVELLKTNHHLFRAFQLTNTAMLLQFALNEADGYRLIQNTDLAGGCHPPDEQFRNYRYHPFQLAFLLISLESIINSESKYRTDVVDLIWFPTGGGKTEAYLAVATLTILWRRMANQSYQGVSVIMRYTLRLLTAQQFERTSRLITVLEYLRQKFVDELKEGPISIGLWIGQSSTPNNLADAKNKMEKILEKGGQANPFQIDKCPWCNESLISNDSNRYHAFEIRTTAKKMMIKCLNENCHFHNVHSGAALPVLVVDEALYNHPPTLLLATVDKFAMLSWKDEGHRFFSSLEQGLPPDLIIQDELHLLSGPLGSISGLFETVVEALCSKEGKTPKIIASTATTRNTDQQVKNLYNRQAYVFPPHGLSYEDSFFARQSEVSNRCYLGFMPSGKTGIDTQVQLLSALFIARLRTYLECGENEDETSPYWTLVSYYNSLRDVGRMSNKVGDEIATTVKQKQKSLGLDTYRFNFSGLKNRTEELTSRIESSKIKQTLGRLEKHFALGTSREGYKYPETGLVDLVLATNMLSVGIDIARLNIMLINGMPRNVAEYIQASSRIGRKDKGLVVSFFDSNRARDKSCFEHFVSFHQSLYKQVEPLSLTPFTPNTIDKMIASVLVTYVRHKIGLNRNRDIKDFDKDKHVSNLKQVIEDRFKQPEIFKYCCERLDRLAQDWHEKINQSDPYKTYDGNTNALLQKPTFQGEKRWKVMQSMRDIDSSSFVQIQIPAGTVNNE